MRLLLARFWGTLMRARVGGGIVIRNRNSSLLLGRSEGEGGLSDEGRAGSRNWGTEPTIC